MSAALQSQARFHVELAQEDDFDGWRDAARGLLAAGVHPDAVDWHPPGAAQSSLFGAGDPPPSLPADAAKLRVPHAFIQLAQTVILHRDPARFDLLYRLLHRIAANRRAAYDAADPLMRRTALMAKEVRRDIHKMRAFVRFRLADAEGGEDHYVAWFEPEHHIVRANAGFFVRRFAAMRWSILTPELCLHWDGNSVGEADGLSRPDVPPADAAEDLWRDYYAAIFNPARLKVKAMVKEMPRKYWKNLPEAQMIPELIASAQAREAAMIATSPENVGNPPSSWSEIETQLAQCTRCSIGCNGTRAVPGEGPHQARLMIVGEQPGDVEEQMGRPFVGPAGKLLDQALAQAGIDRSQVYLTNGVKHFKFELRDGPRGKRRLHKTPSPREIDICRWWLDGETALVKPDLIVALGASAVRAVTGRSVKIGTVRGAIQTLSDGRKMLATVHPSYLLRLPDQARRREEEVRFVDDLRKAALG